MRFSTYNHASRKRRAFTVVELLVVIGIIVLLAGLILGMALRGKRQAERARMESDLQGIATALDAYKQDFGDYPRLPESETFSYPVDQTQLGQANYKSGAEILCWALIGPFPVPNATAPFNTVQDGNPGPGFRVRGTQGLVYGPYLNLDTYHFGTDPNFARYPYLKDMNGKPILYFPARNPRPDATRFAGVNNPGTSTFYLYDFRINGIPFYRQQNLSDGAQAVQRFQGMVGDRNFNGALDADETAINQGPFLLWGTGVDEGFGPENPGVSNEIKNCDDILVPAQ